MADNAKPFVGYPALRKTAKQKKAYDDAESRALVEPLMTVGSAAIAEPLSGLYGLLGGAPERAAERVRAAQEAMMYMPRREDGLRTLRGLGEVVEAVGQQPTVKKTMGLFNTVADTAGEIHPGLGALVKSAPTAALTFAGPGSAVSRAAFKSGAKSLAPVAAEMARTGIEGYMGSAGMRPAMLPPKRYLGRHLDGMPRDVDMGGGQMEQFSTDQRLVDVAGEYMASRGLKHKPMSAYAPLDENRSTRLAEAFAAMPHAPNDPAVARSFEALAQETQAQYEALLRRGYKFSFMRNGDPYINPRNAINDLVQNKRMQVYPTNDGFGAGAGADQTGNPLLRRSELRIDNDPTTTYNDLFRATHDAYGHAQHGNGFRARGEENAFLAHSRMYSDEALPATATELRGQNSWLNFGPSGKSNRNAKLTDTVFADQKTGLMSPWSWIEGVDR